MVSSTGLTEEDAFVERTAVRKRDPRKYLPGVEVETLESSDVEGENGVEGANVTGPRSCRARR